MLADGVARADRQPGQFALVRAVLGRAAEVGEGVDDAGLADLGFALDHDMRQKPHPVAEGDMRADQAIGADFDVRAEPGAVLNDRGRVQPCS